MHTSSLSSYVGSHIISISMAGSTKEVMNKLGAKARQASMLLAGSSDGQRTLALNFAAKSLTANSKKIAAANARDMSAAHKAGMSKAMLDRLELTPKRIEAMEKSIGDIAKLADPLEKKLATFQRPNGLIIDRVSVPLGVIGMIYESRPNVTADAGALCHLNPAMRLSCAAAPTVIIVPPMPSRLACRKG